MQLTMPWLIYPFFSCLALFLIRIGIGIGIGKGKGKGKKKSEYSNLPPSPPPLPIIGNLLWLLPDLDLGPSLRRLRSLLGPIVTLHVPLLPPCVFIMDRDLAYRTLVRHAAAFSHRPPHLGSGRAFRIHANNINTAPYGPRWRRLRHALAVDLLNPSRLASFSRAHRWALDSLLDKLKSSGSGGIVVDAGESFQFATYQALTLICFGDELDEGTIRRLMALQLDYLSLAVKLSAYSLLPSVAMLLYFNRWRRALDLSRKIDELLLPLFRARQQKAKDPSFVSYVDLLLELDLDLDGMVSLCMEFLNASAETTMATLEWVMVHLAKNQEMQGKLYEEIKKARSEGGDVQKIPYLKAVVLEALRRHPPAHVALPHVAGETVEVGGYVIPKGAIVNYALSEINWDEKVWEEPMEFRPERFLGGGEEDIDANATLTAGTEIRMMPFGAGRRMCPGGGLGMMQVRYFVANLVANFRWEVGEGEGQLEERHGFITTKKNPFKARIVSRE